MDWGQWGGIVGAGLVGFFWEGPKNIGIGTFNIGSEVVLGGVDIGNGVLAWSSNERFGYRGYLGQTSNALARGDLSMGDYYYNLGVNTVTFGIYEQTLTGFKLYYGQVTPDEASQTIGGIGVCQLAGSFGLRAGRTPASNNQPGIIGRLVAGTREDVNGLTVAGRALEKHGGRSGSVFPRATGYVAAKNIQGQQILEGILRSNNQRIVHRFGGQDIFDNDTGRGVRFGVNGNMVGFLEP